MTAPIALLRHFPTDWNGEARLQGRTDRPLTAGALARVRALALPQPWTTARLIASPLLRARQTAEALASGRPVALEPALVEQSWGAWEGRRAADLIADPSSGFLPTHLLGPEDRPPGGETAGEVWVRIAPVLARIGAQGVACVIVGHKAVMRLMLRLAAQGEWTGAGPLSRDLMRDLPEIKRARLYPLTCHADGRLSDPAAPVRLIERP